MVQKIYLLLIISLLTLVSRAQNSENRKNLSYSQWVEEMKSCTTEKYTLTNANINYDLATDQRFASDDSAYLANLDSIIIHCDVWLENVSFNTLKFTDVETRPLAIGPKMISFRGNFVFYNGTIVHEFQIANCTFSDSLVISESEVFSAELKNSNLHKGVFLWGLKSKNLIAIRQCAIDAPSHFINSTASNFFLSESSLHGFSISWAQIDRFLYGYNTQSGTLDLDNSEIKNIEIYDNHFSAGNNVNTEEDRYYPIIQMRLVNSDRVFLTRNVTKADSIKKTFYFGNVIVKDKFEISKNEFNANLTLRWFTSQGYFSFFDNTNFDSGVFLNEVEFGPQSNIDWKSLKGKIIQSDFLGLRKPIVIDPKRIQFGVLPEEFSNEKYTEALIKTKRKFYNVFREQGLTENANDVLVEIKNLETAITKNTYENQPSAKSFFDWKANQFLYDFSAYGTDIVKAIGYSLNVILLFAIFYLFFHNDWDYGSSKTVRKRLDFLLDYFRRKDGLHSLYEEQSRKEFEEIKAFSRKVKASRRKVPVSISYIAGWYYKPILSWRIMKLKLLRRIDVLEGSWEEKSSRHQKRSTGIVLLWIFFSVCFALVVKLLNALTLSVNAFTTLGFGSIPTRGIARYAAILQGFIGWGLMTIFSATLIKQFLY